MKNYLVVIKFRNGQYNYQYRVGSHWAEPTYYEMFSQRTLLKELIKSHRLQYLEHASLPIGEGKAYEIVYQTKTAA